MKLITTIQMVMSVAVVACANMAEAQWRSFRSHGQGRGTGWPSLGTAGQMGGTTYYNNANDSSAGMATRMGNTTYTIAMRMVRRMGRQPRWADSVTL